MEIEITDYVFFVIILFVPGYVTSWTIAHNYPSSKVMNGNSILLWSIIDFVVLSMAYLYVTNTFGYGGIANMIAILAISMIGGFLIGWIASIVKKKGWLHWLTSIDDCPTAWDKIFYKMVANTKIMMELTDGRVILSEWNDKSFASNCGKDIFFANYFILEYDTEDSLSQRMKGKHWNYINRGIWISCNNIVYLEVE